MTKENTMPNALDLDAIEARCADSEARGCFIEAGQPGAIEAHIDRAALLAEVRKLREALSLVQENAEASASSYEERVKMIHRVVTDALEGTQP